MYTDMQVEYISGNGNDISVVNAARVSFSKISSYLTYYEQPFKNEKERNHQLASKYIEYIRNIPSNEPEGQRSLVMPFKPNVLSFADFRLIHFLARKSHWTPFAHNSVTLKIKCPIFVSRQLVKHTVGLVINEVSRRYYDGPIELYKMDFKQAGVDKRSEGDTFIERPSAVDDYEKTSIELYNNLLTQGVAAEDARSVLPLNLMTEFYWTGNFASFMRVVKLRTHKDTQRQTRIIGNKIADILKEKFPVSFVANIGD